MQSHWIVNTSRIRSKMNESVKAKVQRVSNQLFRDIFYATPVLTGQLQASWNISHTFPDFTTVDVGGLPEAPLINSLKQISALPNNPKVYICNGKPYAVIMEYGGSNKAPNGMVRLALAKLR